MANLNIFIHGVPQGHDYDASESFFSAFYSEKYDSQELFDIQYKKNNNSIYFTYLRAQNVIGYDNRKSESTYCGITLKIDFYYKNVPAILQILKSAFEGFLVNKIIKEEGGNLKFIVPSFSGDKALKDSIEGFIGGFIQNTYTVNHDNLDPFAMQGKKALSLKDCTVENVRQYLKTASRLCISQNFPSIKEQEIENGIAERIKQENLKKDKEIVDIQQSLQTKQKELSSLEVEKKSLNSQLTQVSAKVEQLSKQLEDYKKQIEKLKEKGDASQLISQIKDPLLKLASNVEEKRKPTGDAHSHHTSSRNDEGYSTKDLLKIGISAASLIVSLAIAVFLFFFQKDKTISCNHNDICQKVEQAVVQGLQTQQKKGKITCDDGNPDTLMATKTYTFKYDKWEDGCKWSVTGPGKLNGCKENDKEIKVLIQQQATDLIIKCGIGDDETKIIKKVKVVK